MLSVLIVDEVEKRFGEVPEVESATVNFAVGNAITKFFRHTDPVFVRWLGAMHIVKREGTF